jgi:hypothetical protein
VSRIRLKLLHVTLLAPHKKQYTLLNKWEELPADLWPGETIPIRLFLGGFDLTPTFRDVNKKYSTRYYLSLVLIDEGKQNIKKHLLVRMFSPLAWNLPDRFPMANQLAVRATSKAHDHYRGVVCYLHWYLRFQYVHTCPIISHGIPPEHFNSRSAIETTSDQSWWSFGPADLRFLSERQTPHAKPHLVDTLAWRPH